MNKPTFVQIFNSNRLRIILLFFILNSTFYLTAAKASSQSPGTEINEGQIDSIIIINQNIFNVDSSKYNHWPFKLANKLHIKTKKYIVRRELLQKEGDFFSRQLADETERNLRALPYLWFARVRFYKAEGKNIMEVTTADSWTLSAGISMRRSAGQNSVRFRVEESNFLGFGQYLSCSYHYRDFDENFLQIAFQERRLLGKRQFFDFYYDSDPEVGLMGIGIGLPFYSLDAGTRYVVYYSALDRREDYYSDGKLAARNRAKGRWLNLSLTRRFGSYRYKLTVGADFQYKDVEYFDKEIYYHPFNITFPEDSLYYNILPNMGLYDVVYYQTRRINAFSKIEDFQLLKGIIIELGAAYSGTGDKKKLLNVAGMQVLYAVEFASNMLFFKAGRRIWYKHNHDFRKAAYFSIRYYNNKLYWITAVVRTSYDSNIRDDGTETVYLGENSGVRGYPKNYSTGERRFVVNVENRLYSGIEIFAVNIGFVQFFDVGQTWNRNEKPDLKKAFWSVGAGLRLGFDRASSSGVMRLDLAYAGDLSEWQVSFGVGQYVE